MIELYNKILISNGKLKLGPNMSFPGQTIFKFLCCINIPLSNKRQQVSLFSVNKT